MWGLLVLIGLVVFIVLFISLCKKIIQNKDIKKASLWTMVGLVFFAITTNQYIDSRKAEPVVASVLSSTPQPSKATPIPVPSASPKEEPKTPAEKVKAAALKNFDDAKVDLQDDGWTEITVPGSDNFTNNMIKTGMLSGIAKTMQGLKDIPEVTDVTITVTFPMVDKFGNESDQMVMRATFLKANRDKINWLNFSYSNIPDVANSYNEHPFLRK